MVPDIVSGLQAKSWNTHSVQTTGIILGYPMKETSTYIPCDNGTVTAIANGDRCFEPKYSAYLKIKYRNKAAKDHYPSPWVLTDIKICEYYHDLCSSSNLTAYIDVLSARLPIRSHIVCLYEQDNVTDVRLTYKEVSYFGQYTLAGILMFVPAVAALLFFIGTIIHWRLARPGYTSLPDGLRSARGDEPAYKRDLQLVIEG
jgi:hypothetical protein